MVLPRKPRPVFNTNLPLSKKQVVYYPMRREEEKILLMAKEAAKASPNEAEAMAEVLPAIKQVVDGCVAEPLPPDLPLVDLEYMFIQIRIVSVAENVPVAYFDPGDEKNYNFQVNLQNVKVTQPKNVEPHIQLDDKLVLQMRYPPASLYSNREFLTKSGEDQLDTLIVACLDKLYDNDQMTSFADVPMDEAMEWVNDMDRKDFEKVREFLENLPNLEYKINYKNTKEQEREIVLSTLTDFFTFV